MTTALFKTLLHKQFTRYFMTRQSEKIQKQPLGKKETIQLFDATNLQYCKWPETEEGRYAQKCLVPFIMRGVSTFISNVQTDLRVLIHGELVLPITINLAEYDNSYVCSPYSYFISYAKESLASVSKKLVFHSLYAFLCGVENVFKRFKINKVVIVNNWCYSTNLYPRMQPKQLAEIVQYLKQRFPDYAIVFRSVDRHSSPTCYQSLQNLGFTYIASRQIYFIEPWTTTLFDSRLFKCDLKLLNNSGYEIVDGENLTEKELPRLLDLYRTLYLEKFSSLNPQFTEQFLQLALRDKMLHFKALKKEGRIDGIVGFVERNGEMFCPFFGYDRSLPQEIALYRLLSTVLMLEADRRHLLFHQSSGASMFKKIRKAQSCIEFTAVDYRHLRLKRQIPWIILDKICNSLGIILMKRY